MTAFAKGAKVWPFYNWHLYNKAARITADGQVILTKKLYRFQDVRQCVSGARLASVANKARRRKKGPLVRFGRRV
jgi:hypothetical protein